MLPVVKFCKLSSRLRLHTRVNQIKHSPVFSLKGNAKESYEGIVGAIRVSKDEYVLDSFGQYMRHSSDPSCVVVNRCVIATRDLNPGDELTYDCTQDIKHKYL
jgi:hypothetical protein